MRNRELGRTGKRVFPLGFGAMRMPESEKEAIRLIETAFSLGINYFDTAPAYMQGTSENTLGKALRGKRDQVFLASKNPIRDESGVRWRQRLEQSLQKMQVEYLDFYFMWSIDWEMYQEKIDVPNGPLEAAWKAKEEGLIRHLCFSVHDIRENVQKILDQQVFEVMLCQYNLLDRELETMLTYAKNSGVGTAVMGPVAGGRLGAPSPVLQSLLAGEAISTAELALRFVFAHEDVDLVLSGMGTEQMVRENVATAQLQEPLTGEEKKKILQAMEEKQKLAYLYCTGCSYCLPCPGEVNIPEIFTYFNHAHVYGLLDYAKTEYQLLGQENHWVEGKNARSCLQCGLCEEKCPQKIPIRKRLEEIERILSQAPQERIKLNWYPR